MRSLMMKSKSAYIVIVHGSRDKDANLAFEAFLKKCRNVLTGGEVYGAFLELAKPSIPEALESALQAGANEVFIVPMMFFSGRHVKEDIPRLIQEAKAKYPEADFHYSSPLADHPLMTELIKDKAMSLKKRGQ